MKLKEQHVKRGRSLKVATKIQEAAQTVWQEIFRKEPVVSSYSVHLTFWAKVKAISYKHKTFQYAVTVNEVQKTAHLQNQKETDVYLAFISSLTFRRLTEKHVRQPHTWDIRQHEASFIRCPAGIPAVRLCCSAPENKNTFTARCSVRIQSDHIQNDNKQLPHGNCFAAVSMSRRTMWSVVSSAR